MEKLLGCEEAALHANVSSSTIARWAKSGKLPGARKIGRGWLVPESALQPPEEDEVVQAETYRFPNAGDLRRLGIKSQVQAETIVLRLRELCREE